MDLHNLQDLHDDRPNELPDELWFQILLWVPYRDLLKIRSVSTMFVRLISDRVFWETKSILEFGYNYRFLNQRHPYSGYIYVLLQYGHIDYGSDEFYPRDKCLLNALQGNDLALIRGLLYSPGGDIDRQFVDASKYGYVELLRLLPIPPTAIILYSAYLASRNGHLDVVKYFFDTYVPLTKDIYDYANLGAAEGDRDHVLDHLARVSKIRIQISDYIDKLIKV